MEHFKEIFNLCESMLTKHYEEKRALEEQIRQLEEQANSYQSAEIDKLVAAIVEANLTMPAIVANRINAHFKNEYIDIHGIMETIKDPLAKQGLVIKNHTEEDAEKRTYMATLIMHTSGQWMRTRMRLPEYKDGANTKAIMQQQGSDQSYVRRYNIFNLLGLGLENDPLDDDGNLNAGHATYDDEATPSKSKVATNLKARASYGTPVISKEELKTIKGAIAEAKLGTDWLDKLLDYYGITGLADIPKDQYQIVMNNIDKNKRAAI